MSIKLGKNMVAGVAVGGLSSDDIVDNLESTDATLALSANQGRILDEKIIEHSDKLAEHTEQISTNASNIAEHAETHNIKTYTSLEQLGLSDEDFVTDDFQGNMLLLKTTLPTSSTLTTLIGTPISNLQTSIINKINDDTGNTHVLTSTVAFCLRKLAGNSSPVIVDCVLDGSTDDVKKIYTLVIDTTSSGTIRCSKFSQSFNENGFLPLTGGTLTNGFTIEKASNINVVLRNLANSRQASYSTTSDGFTGLYNEKTGDTSNNRVAMWLGSEDMTNDKLFRINRKLNGSNETFQVFGEHNKPTGSYTGNGSATSRTINTGGIGNMLLIRSGSGTAIVTPNGAITIATNYTISWMPFEEITYDNGVLKTATANTIVNSSGTTHNYYCI